MNDKTTPSSSVAAISSEDIEKLPGRITVKRSHGGLSVEYRWATPMNAAFTIALILAIVGFRFELFTDPAGISTTLWVMLAVLAPVYLSLIGSMINKTTLTATPHGIRIRRGPIPWPGLREIANADIEQLYVRARAAHRNGGPGDPQVFDVVAQTVTGKDVVLVKNLETIEQGHTIQRILEPSIEAKRPRALAESASATVVPTLATSNETTPTS